MTKAELEEIVGIKMCDEVFSEVIQSAERKQMNLIRLGCGYADEDEYFDQLVIEQFRAKCFTEFTIILCRTLTEIEKEHRIISPDTL